MLRRKSLLDGTEYTSAFSSELQSKVAVFDSSRPQRELLRLPYQSTSTLQPWPIAAARTQHIYLGWPNTGW